MLVAAILLTCIIPCTAYGLSCDPEGRAAFAQEDGERLYAEYDRSAGLTFRNNASARSISPEAINYLYQALLRAEVRIDMSPFGLEMDEMQDVLDAVLDSHPEVFYVNGGSWGSGWNSTLVEYFRPGYIVSAEKIPQMITKYESMMRTALDWVSADMTELEKAKALHDYVLVRCQYAYGSSSALRHTSYGALVDGSAACDGYASLYWDLCTRAGLNCIRVNSIPMMHGWNMVQVDGEWYHADLTWDDTGGYEVEYFLKSDEYFLEHGHHGWYEAHDCSSTKYDKGGPWGQYTEPLSPHPYDFFDVLYSDWFASEDILGYALEHNLMTGYGDGFFGPYDSITRGQAAVVLWRIAGQPTVSAAEFTDVDYGVYYGSAIKWARVTGVVSGYGGTNTFGPGDFVTREQFCVMLANYAEKVAHVSTATNCVALDRIAGADQVSPWAREQMGWAVDEGIISGEATASGTWVNPQGNTLRSTAAKMASVFHRDVLGLG